MCVCFQLISCVWLLATPWTAARQTPLSMGILQARILEWAAISFSRLQIIEKLKWLSILSILPAHNKIHSAPAHFPPHSDPKSIPPLLLWGLSPQLNTEGFRSWSCLGLRRQMPSVCHSLAAAQLAQPVSGVSCWQIPACYLRVLSFLLAPCISFRRAPWVPQTFFPRHRPGMSVAISAIQPCCFMWEALKDTCLLNGGLSHWLL